MARRPLVQPPPEELARIRRELGVDENNLPLDLTADEHLAALNPGIAAPPPEPPVTTPAAPAPSFSLPSWLILTAKIIASLSGVALMVVAAIPTAPVWVPLAVFALGSAAAVIAGLSLPSPFAGKPVLAGTAAVAVGGAATAIFTVAAAMPPGMAQSALLALAMVLAGAAGVPLPQVAKTP